jgi:hypothetical protein
MSAPFKPHWNFLSRLSLAVVAGGAGLTLLAIWGYWRTPYGERLQEEVVQPVMFDHRHHVVDDLIDCRYCHFNVERGASAGIPSTGMCLNCHSQIWNKSPKLAPVRESYFTGKPIEWVRVHQVPAFAYFNHAIHVAKGVGCATCHGRVDQMPAITKVAPLTMQWCLDCHRNPAPSLRPADQITSMTWQPPADPAARAALATELMKKNDVHSRVSCTTCHR